MSVARIHQKQIFCDQEDAKTFEDTLRTINSLASSVMAMETLLTRQLEEEMDGAEKNWFLREGMLVAIRLLSSEISDKASFLDMKIN